MLLKFYCKWSNLKKLRTGKRHHCEVQLIIMVAPRVLMLLCPCSSKAAVKANNYI